MKLREIVTIVCGAIVGVWLGKFVHMEMLGGLLGAIVGCFYCRR